MEAKLANICEAIPCYLDGPDQLEHPPMVVPRQGN